MNSDDERHERREAIVKRLCGIMGWKYEQGLVWAGLRKVAIAEAVAVSVEKLEEIADRLDADNEELAIRESFEGPPCNP